MSKSNGKRNGKLFPNGNGFVQGLWQTYVASSRTDLGLRNKLVEYYLNLAIVAAGHFARKLPVDYDDLYQLAAFGLMEAVEAFDPKTGVKFETFSSHRVRGAILDGLRNQDWVSRLWRQRKKKLEQVSTEFKLVHDREPTIGELAKKLQLPEEKVQELLTTDFSVRSLDQVDSEDHPIYQPASDEVGDDIILDERDSIEHHLKGLNDLERTIILMYFDEEFTMDQIGEMLGLSESRISQIVKDIINFLRHRTRNERKVG